MRIEFEHSCILLKTTHHAKKIVTIRTKDGRQFNKLGDKPELQNVRSQIDSILYPHRPSRLLVGPLRLSITVTWPWNTSDPKRITNNHDRWPHETKPDCENLAKGLVDGMVRNCYFAEDSRVVDLRVRKFRGDNPSVKIILEELNESQP